MEFEVPSLADIPVLEPLDLQAPFALALELRREFELKTTPVYGVHVEVYEGASRIPVGHDTGWSLSLVPVEGSAGGMGSRGEGTLIVRKPGLYLLRIQAPEGYHAVPDQPIKLSAGPFPTMQVKVTRK